MKEEKEMKIRLSGNENEINSFIENIRSNPSLLVNSVSLPYANNRKVAYSTEVRVYIDVSVKPVVSFDTTGGN